MLAMCTCVVMHSAMQAKMSGLEKYKPELAANAKKMVMPGKGLLACDESTGTVGKRLVRSHSFRNALQHDFCFPLILYLSLVIHICNPISFAVHLPGINRHGKQ